ncbi:MAG: FKBP-type peptidyl-prolyl cis-trans isomerase [Puniceicoccales bacterium]|nr:FKBP-type peptidyl-prolyl cis-trans isomerase [Puniceicoccales bacterium]
MTTTALFADEKPAATPAATTPPAEPAPVPAAPVAPVAPAPKPLTEAQKAKLLEALGWFIAQGREPLPLEVFGFTSGEIDHITSGLRRGASGEDLSAQFKESTPFFQEFLSEKAKANEAKMKAKNEERLKAWETKNKDFLREKDKDATVKNTPTGLRYKIVVPGSAEKPVITSKVKVTYVGKLVDGTVFDSSAKHGNQPVEFRLNEVIPGWGEGLQKIGKGGKILLYVPASLGYGDTGGGGAIPPKATLEFEVELLDFSNEPPPSTAAPAPSAATGGAAGNAAPAANK